MSDLSYLKVTDTQRYMQHGDGGLAKDQIAMKVSELKEELEA